MLLLLACTDPQKLDDTEDDTGGGTAAEVGTVDIRLSDGAPTVLIASWDTPADYAWVEYGADTTYGMEAPARGEGQALVLGLPPDTEVHARVALEVGGNVSYSDDFSLTTGSVPTGLPDVTVDEVDPSSTFGEFVLGSWYVGSTGLGSVVFYNREGIPVWWSPPREGLVIAARAARDGQAVYYLWDQDLFETSTAEICRVDLSGEGVTCFSTPYAHHDFWELEDGTLAYVAQDIQTASGETLVGDTLRYLAPDGTLTERWSAFDDITPVRTEDWDQFQTPDGIDWTHVNGLWHDPAEDAWYLSFFFFEEVRKIPMSTGRTEWVLGGLENEFTFTGSTFGPQHAPQLVDGGILVFDNGDQGTPSRVATFSLDTTAYRASDGTSWENPDGRHTSAVGDGHLHDDGVLAGAFGDAGQLVVWNPDGSVAWELSPDLGTTAGQVYVYDSLYALTE